MTISKNLPETIAVVPTAQTIHDALAVSPYMDHVVDAWISAYVRQKVASALAFAASTSDDMGLPATTDPALQASADAASAELQAAHQEMLTRWTEYRMAK